MKTLLRNRWLWAAAALLLLWAAFSATFAYTPAIEGRVVDAKTGKPIANARVRAVWYGSRFAFVDFTSAIQDVAATSTDKGGNFEFMPVLKRLEVPLLDRAGVRYFDVFAYGYEPVHVPRATARPTIRLRPAGDDYESCESLIQAESLMGVGSSYSRSVTEGDERFLQDGWQWFFTAFPQGPSGRFRQEFSRSAGYIPVKDAAEAVLADSPGTAESRSAALWLRTVRELYRQEVGR